MSDDYRHLLPGVFRGVVNGRWHTVQAKILLSASFLSTGFGANPSSTFTGLLAFCTRATCFSLRWVVALWSFELVSRSK